MIQLRSDCLVFETAAGHAIPCSAELVTIELIGEAAGLLDPEMIRNATAAVLHYFKEELNRQTVSVAEFSQALEQVLRGFGLTISSAGETLEPDNSPALDLRRLARDSGKNFELLFFPRLRDELRQQLKDSPRLVRCQGLRPCVKQLAGAQRWSGRCEFLSDQIVDYLRRCLSADFSTGECSLLVR
ncbi:MAG: hypothetical protein HY043_22035 [Verrucomicrobia bacterium]|nr:hypothetical protein [Verrucomicrobiota bacterium]